MSRPQYEVADVIRQWLSTSDTGHLLKHHLRTLSAIARCRTEALGGHVDQCTSCGHLKISYNSCRNRHCPKCQGLNKEMWVIQQEDMLLPVAYYHVVFTLPSELHSMCLHYPAQMYHLLFKAVWHTINTLARDPEWLGAQTAATMVLHTWSQTLSLHPHVHCIVPDGGLRADGQWQFPKKGTGNFLFPVKAMQQIFKGYYMSGVKQLVADKTINLAKVLGGRSYKAWKDTLYGKHWVVYTKKPFSGVKHVVDYLARYSHRVAITNHRILSISEEAVTFSYKSYRQGGKKKVMRLSIEEFVRRFCLHILPPRFRKIRACGMHSNAAKGKRIRQARSALGVKHSELLDRAQRKEMAKERLFGPDLHRCPECKEGLLERLVPFAANKSPPEVIALIQVCQQG